MDLELISFKLCPFVQRSVITLLHKAVDHRVTYIDLADPPAWFKEISPFGKVPLLRVDGDTVLFESAVINEFIDDITPPPLQPSDPLKRALNRAWIEFGSECLMNQFQLLTAQEEADFQSHYDELAAKMRRLESILGDGPYFNGPDLSLVDTAYAPLFMRQAILSESGVLGAGLLGSKVREWSQALLALSAVQNSVVGDFKSLLIDRIQKMGGHAASLISH